MLLNLSEDPGLGEFQVAFEQQYGKNKNVFYNYARAIEQMLEYFGRERKPRDVFRSDALAWAEWLSKYKKFTPGVVNMKMQVARSYFRFIKELGYGEDDGYNPFAKAGPRRIRVTTRH